MVYLKCAGCGFEKIVSFLTLGDIPPVNAFILPAEIAQEVKYPLNLAYCPQCFLVQLEEIVPPETLFRQYLHLSAGSQQNISHLKEVAAHLAKKHAISGEKRVLEIGSNDGTLLSFFKQYTLNILGVDPAKNLISLNKEKGVPYIPEFFNTSTASQIVKERGKFDFIIGLNVIPHTPDNIDLLKGARILMNDKCLLIMEGVYALETILRGEFDTIYHEHVYTFSLHSLIALFRMAGMKVIDVERIATQGGSLRICAMKEEYASEVSSRVLSLLEEEKKIGFDKPETYLLVEKKVAEFKIHLRNLINEEKKRGGKLIGLGAPARGVVILNYCQIGKEDIAFIVDDTSLKQGRVTPGVHIPVQSFESIGSNTEKRTFLLLSWNYKEDYLRRLKEKYASFRMIVPFPKLEVIEHG
ncbi:class I SAM-dependent methyltransferase [Candidatus Pacearchaeota archaeon]|nr:class I SAM-dependent methyltransferase [Candidatus Pacearchaeota archaeon]